MERIKYIQAADLHLNTPFSGLQNNDEKFVEELREAPFKALQKLAELCAIEKPDFIVIAGDLYNQENDEIHPLIAFRNFLEKLNQLSIPVYISFGNHDPLSHRSHSIAWPENTFFFGSEPHSYPVKKNDEIIALIHGASYSQNPEPRNLARLYGRNMEFDGFQLGVLHTDLKKGKGYEKYAPCNLDDLLMANLDAWALGHVHEREIMHPSPFIAYSGTTQGTSINETGPKGCLVVTAEKHNGNWNFHHSFAPLNVIEWIKLYVNITELETIEEIVTAIREKVDNFLLNEASPGILKYIYRIYLEGQTPLYYSLEDELTRLNILHQLNGLEEASSSYFIKDLKTSLTLPQLDKIELEQNLLGEIWRYAESLEKDEEALNAFFQKALSELWSFKLIKEHFSIVEAGLGNLPVDKLFQQAKIYCLKSLRKD